MALKKCKECGNQVSTKATSCTQCGAPVKGKGFSITSIPKLMVLGFLALFIYSLLFPDTPSNPEKTTARPSQIAASKVPEFTKTVSGEQKTHDKAAKIYYVIANKTAVHLAPSDNARVTNNLYRQMKQEVFETDGKWVRISNYYDGSAEGVSHDVANWVLLSDLSTTRPPDLPQPKLAHDPRIDGLPQVGGRTTERDLKILHAAAKHYLNTGKCSRIEYGDKSISKKNTYYLNCGGPKNLFFVPSNIPGLE